jgi:MFS family permease
MMIGLAILSRTTESTSTTQIVLALVVFGLGAGLALPALTDTVMAAVPERDAGVGSAVNDVSRQLGGALGVAVIGSFVISAYRTNLHHAVRGDIPAAALRAASSSIGVAEQTARHLPPKVATTLTHAANHAFVSAITRGFEVSMVVVALAFVVAATMVPRRMRTTQLEAEPSPPPQASPPHEWPEPALRPLTAPTSWARPATAHLPRQRT